MNLDDRAAIAAADPSDALGAVERTAEQWAEATMRARAVEELPSPYGITGVVYCGMGGSGIAGDVIAAIAQRESRVPVTVVKGYELPASVSSNSLVICSSYSGETEETLSCFDGAVERKARSVVITTGGRLGARADEHRIARIAPAGGLKPRAALASLTVAALVVLERLGIVGDLAAELADAEAHLAGRSKSLGRDVPAADNEAKGLATTLVGTLPIIWGQDGILAVAAQRWRCQLNENAKLLAFSSTFPELDHNEIEGYASEADVATRLAVVVLRSPAEDPRIVRRIAPTLDRMRERVGSVSEAWATGDTTLARLMSIAMLGDFTSVYLALCRGVDPTPTPELDGIKRALGG